MKRSRLKADPEKVRAWQDRSRKPLKRGRALVPVSAKQRKVKAQRRRVLDEVMERDGGCVARELVVDVACWGPLDGHEPLTRGRGGDPLDPENVLTLCRSHHDWTHLHPKEATALGLLRSAA